MTFGLFLSYSAKCSEAPVSSDASLCHACFDMNCTCSCLRFTVHKSDNSVGYFHCYTVDFVILHQLLYRRHVYQNCTKIRRYTTILNNTNPQTGNIAIQLLNRSDTETLSNCFASHVTCLVSLIAPGIGYMYLNATYIFLCHSFTRCRQIL